MVHIALLRGVNVGGHRLVAMADLRAWLTQLGYEDVRSLLQSGNLVFRGGRRTGAPLEAHLEAEARRALDLETDFIVRTPAQWGALVAANPFPAVAAKEPAKLLVVCLKTAPTPAGVAALATVKKGKEALTVVGSQLYIHYPDGAGRSKINPDAVGRALGVRGTARNWNTVQKLAAMVAA